VNFAILDSCAEQSLFPFCVSHLNCTPIFSNFWWRADVFLWHLPSLCSSRDAV